MMSTPIDSLPLPPLHSPLYVRYSVFHLLTPRLVHIDVSMLFFGNRIESNHLVNDDTYADA
jgi:hypothetical protein